MAISRVHLIVLVALLGAYPVPAKAQAIDLEPVVERLVRPVFVTHAGDSSGRLFVVEQEGRILIAQDGVLRPEPFLDLTAKVLSGGERGLLGLAFHPAFAENRRFFVNYTRQPDGATVISEFRATVRNPNRAREAERVLLRVPQRYQNHNGGMLAFGPDGYLYIGMGDGGSGGDPHNYAQNRQSLLGKILRFDVDGARPYAIPPDNPFVNRVGRPEIFALGLRNPWRFSFDRRTGWLFAGDVGERRVEEINRILRGRNYGWRIMEGSLCFRPANCQRTGLTLPIHEYRHNRGRCSVTGGYVYRGRAIRGLAGTYLFADFCTGEIFGLRQGERSLLLDTDLRIASFGEDEAGEIYVVALSEGVIYRIVADPR